MLESDDEDEDDEAGGGAGGSTGGCTQWVVSLYLSICLSFVKVGFTVYPLMAAIGQSLAPQERARGKAVSANHKVGVVAVRVLVTKGNGPYGDLAAQLGAPDPLSPHIKVDGTIWEGVQTWNSQQEAHAEGLRIEQLLHGLLHETGQGELRKRGKFEVYRPRSFLDNSTDVIALYVWFLFMVAELLGAKRANLKSAESVLKKVQKCERKIKKNPQWVLHQFLKLYLPGDPAPATRTLWTSAHKKMERSLSGVVDVPLSWLQFDDLGCQVLGNWDFRDSVRDVVREIGRSVVARGGESAAAMSRVLLQGLRQSFLMPETQDEVLDPDDGHLDAVYQLLGRRHGCRSVRDVRFEREIRDRPSMERAARDLNISAHWRLSDLAMFFICEAFWSGWVHLWTALAVALEQAADLYFLYALLLWLCRLQDGSSECGYWRCDLCFKGFVSSAASNWEVWACGVSDRFWTGKRSGRRSNDLHPPSSPEEDNADTDDEGGGGGGGGDDEGDERPNVPEGYVPPQSCSVSALFVLASALFLSVVLMIYSAPVLML